MIFRVLSTVDFISHRQNLFKKASRKHSAEGHQNHAEKGDENGDDAPGV